jgi:[ribosomal protein S5]-alanine N-acetyltransferase
MRIIAETPRLILREMVSEDAAGMFELDSDPEVLLYLGTPPMTQIEQSRDLIRQVQQQYADHGVGRVTVILKSTGEYIGWSGLKFNLPELNGCTRYYDLGYRFLPRFWGCGYGLEAAQASMDYGFNTLQIDSIYAGAMIDNIGSRRILEKVGMTFQNEFVLENIPASWAWYEGKKIRV